LLSFQAGPHLTTDCDC